MSHASRQGSGPRPGVEVALPGARRCGPDPALGGPARAQTERVWLSNQAADPQPAGAARVCAPACACARGGEEAPVLERAGSGNSPHWPASTQPRPADRRRPWRGRPRQARAPRATAPTPPRRRAGRFAQAAAGSGSRPAPPGPAALACPPGRPARPRPAPPRCATLPKLEAEPWQPHSRRAHGGGGGGGGEGEAAAAQLRRARQAGGEGEAAPARPSTDRGGRPRRELGGGGAGGGRAAAPAPCPGK